MSDHKIPDVDPKELERAQQIWHSFVVCSKYSTIATIIILVALTFGFVKLF